MPFLVVVEVEPSAAEFRQLKTYCAAAAEKNDY